jgi:hypothetical protein
MNKISRTGIISCLIRAGNFIEGPAARARSRYTRMSGLLGIHNRSMNSLAIRAAEANILNRILTETGHSEKSVMILMRKLPEKKRRRIIGKGRKFGSYGIRKKDGFRSV